MVSPELLRRYPFFAQLDPDQLASIAMHTDEFEYEDSFTLFEQGEAADSLYFLLSGCVDLYHTVREAYAPSDRREALVCQINPGEVFGISALIPPHQLTSAARSNGPSRVMQIKASELTELFAQDPQLEFKLLQRIAQAAMLRLHATRVQLAAALV